MPKQIPQDELNHIRDVVGMHPSGIAFGALADALDSRLPRRTLQNRLKYLIRTGRIVSEGRGRCTTYRLSETGAAVATAFPSLDLSAAGKQIADYVTQPLIKRKVVGYDRKFLDSYRPNKSAYLYEAERAHLHEIGKASISAQPAGTYARQILDRLLIDLSYNSSRLEGNTYSKLDTKRLLEFGKRAEGKDLFEAQMILNHKDAIEFLVSGAENIGFNKHTILSLHGLLANNLLGNSLAEGRLRTIAVGIHGSSFEPLAVPQLIDENFRQLLDTAEAIKDPFEQSFFAMVHLPYLQPFEDANKRVSRLAANIPLIKDNLIPLTFLDLTHDLYTQALLGVYELNRVDLLKDVYLWAYERSAERYSAVRQSLGDPDPFRLKFRDELRYVIKTIIQRRLDRPKAFDYLEEWNAENIAVDDRARFLEVAEDDILSLHEGNFAKYKVRPSEFEEWQKIWAHNIA